MTGNRVFVDNRLIKGEFGEMSLSCKEEMSKSHLAKFPLESSYLSSRPSDWRTGMFLKKKKGAILTSKRHTHILGVGLFLFPCYSVHIFRSRWLMFLSAGVGDNAPIHVNSLACCSRTLSGSIIYLSYILLFTQTRSSALRRGVAPAHRRKTRGSITFYLSLYCQNSWHG